MMRQTGTTLVLAMFALTAVGCDDDPAGPGDDTLSQTEAAELAAAMSAVGNTMLADAFMTNQTGASAGAAPMAEESFSFEFDRSRPCEAGGVVDVVGTLDMTWDQEAGWATAVIASTMTHDDCGVEGENHTFTTNGDPNLELTADMSMTDGQLDGEQTMTLVGAFTWTDDADRSGRCEVDLTTTLDPANSTSTTSGTFCGHTVETETTVEIDPAA